jgi:lysophospholipase L1-like esterase
MSLRRRNALMIAGAVLLPVLAVAYALRRAGELPENHPRRFVKQNLLQPGKKVVACLGASMVHGRIGFNFVDRLAQELQNEGFQFVNAGINGDLAYNALKRLPDVIACRPHTVVILVGTNDVLASQGPREAARYRWLKKLPVRASQKWYRENLIAILSALQGETDARLAIGSLPALGDELASPLNQRIEEYNAVIEEIAREAGVIYLPIHEALAEVARAAGPRAGRAFDGRTWWMLKGIVQHYVLGWSWDRISLANGFLLQTDGIHLNSRAGVVVAERIAALLRQIG